MQLPTRFTLPSVSFTAMTASAVPAVELESLPGSPIPLSGSPLNELANRSVECVGNGYGTFYDDTACTKNPSVAFGLDNPDCLVNMGGKKSVYIQPGCKAGSIYSLVFSPGTACDCQNDCAKMANASDQPNKGGQPISTPNSCWDISGFDVGSAFRFIGGGCDANNCRT